MRECNEYEITVQKLLKVVHRYTERIKIHVVSDIEMFKDNQRHEFNITENFSENESEINRVLKYYGDVPVWNIHVDIDNAYSGHKGRFSVASIVANCYYSDARDGFLREKDDLRKAKRREYNRRRMENKENA